MESTPEGRLMKVKAEQPENALSPMSIRVPRIITEERFLHREKALSLIVFTEDGSSMVAIEEP